MTKNRILPHQQREGFSFDDIINESEDYFSKFGLARPPQNTNTDQDTASEYSNLLNRSKPPLSRQKRVFRNLIGIIIISSFICGCVLLAVGLLLGVLINIGVVDAFCNILFEFKKQAPLDATFIFEKIKTQASTAPYYLAYAFSNNFTIGCYYRPKVFGVSVRTASSVIDENHIL